MADPFDIWSVEANGFRPILESLFCRNGATTYSAYPKNKRVCFGWPEAQVKDYLLALGEDKTSKSKRCILFRLSVGPDHGLVYHGSPFRVPPTGNPKDIKDRVDCDIPYGGSLPEGFQGAVEKAFAFMLRDPELARLRAPNSPPDVPTKPAPDTAEPPSRVKYETLRIVRDTAMALDVKKTCKRGCQLCGVTLMLGDVPYSEAHHLQPLGGDYRGLDVRENLLSVCPNCHAKLDYGAVQIDIKKLFHSDLHCPSEGYIAYHNETMHDKKGII